MAPDVDVCKECRDNFIVSTKCIKCDRCNQSFHPSCVSIKDNWMKIISECDSLMWFCNECKSPASHRSEEEKCLLLQEEVDCLKPELSCTVKLLEGLEYTVELQESLLKCNVGNAFTSPSSVNHLQSGSSTYSEALMKPKVNNSSVLLIKANNDVFDTDVFRYISTSVNPAEINVCIYSTRKIKNGLVVLCKDEKSLERLKVNLNSNKALNSIYTISESKRFKPRLLIKNVKLNNLNTPEQFIERITTLNKIEETSHIKYVTKLKHFESTNLVIEVSPDLRKLILNKGYLYVAWKRCEVSDHIHILRCSKCCAYGYTVKNCSLDVVCGKCAQHHKFAFCKSTSEECVNCINRISPVKEM
nr:unnamed protein product [Callosobruchus analis]